MNRTSRKQSLYANADARRPRRTGRRLTVRSSMKGSLPIARIMSEFDSEWVVLANARFDRNGQLTDGKLVWHSKDRDEVYRKALELRPRRAAFLYTGRMPKNTAIIL